MAVKPFASSGDLAAKQQSLEVLADGVYALTAEGDPNVGAVEGEDFLGSRGALIEQPPQRLVPHRMVGGQEGQQLGLGNGPGAGVIPRTGP